MHSTSSPDLQPTHSWVAKLFSSSYTPATTSHKLKYPTNSVFGLLTQNTRGFRDDMRHLWIAAWKAQIDSTNIHYIFIQETHIGSQREANDLQLQWARAWGRQHNPDRPLSFWSVADPAAAGVAILTRPDLPERFEPLQILDRPGRVIAISSPTTTLVNLYAPTDKTQREQLFTHLATAAHSITGKWFLAGDINCVLVPTRDRHSTRHIKASTESPALSQLVQQLQLSDAVDHYQPQTASPTTHLTYHIPQSDFGARLDRCYASPEGTRWISGGRTVVPQVSTDHMGVVTWLRDPDLRPRQRPIPPLLYPIRGRNQEAIDTEIADELRRIFGSKTHRPWDVALQHVAASLRDIKIREKKRARRATLKWERRLRERIRSRQDLIDYEQGRLARRIERRLGGRLLASGDGANTLYGRLTRRSNRPISKLDGPDNSSIADRFATAWSPLLTTSHATVPVDERCDATQHLFRIPQSHRLDAADNDALMATITATEVEQTIANLGAHKAGGADRLNNDFYRALAPILSETLAHEYNRILQGDAMPDSFREAVMVPLPKKILAKPLASRVQRSLGKVINADQNGFVRGRDMANNAHLMQALLAQDHDCDSNAAADSPVAVLLDFKKAYDSLDRRFLVEALRSFGYAAGFIGLVERLHAGTTARFLANGDLTASIQVRTGIRQGCPLAPLLFLIAAETLKYAIAQTPGLTGVSLSTAGVTVTHSFSAFVDDSVVFVQRGSMLTAVVKTLADFAAISGLQVQPTKSNAIVLNPHCDDQIIGVFPIVPYGTTVTYLGVDVGLGDPAGANWERRLQALQKSLGAASGFTTSLHDRVTVLNTIGLPAVLFTAKYASPSTAILRELDSLWRRYLWHGTVTRSTVRAHPIAREILELPRRELGLGLRDFREAMIDQAARVILNWNTKIHDKYWAALHLLITQAGAGRKTTMNCYPSHTDSTRNTRLDGHTSLLALGWKRVNAALVGRYPVPPATTSLKASALQRCGTATGSLRWLSSARGQFSLPVVHGID